MNNNIWVATSTLEVQSNNNKNWSNEDEMNLTNAILASEKEWGANSCTAKWLKSIKGRVQPQPKQEWSEEDEKMMNAVIADIQFRQKAHNHEANQAVYEREIDWLKSIKDRVQPQPKQKWSEEDEKFLNYAISLTDDAQIKNFLKSLKPQPKQELD